MSSKPRKTRRTKATEKAKAVVKEAEKEVEAAARAVEHEAEKAERVVKRPRRAKAALARPTGRAPTPTVMSRHGTSMISREGRGFSRGELSGAGIAPGVATRWGVRLDPRRRSVIEGNVSALKGWHSRASVASGVKKEAEALEHKVEEVGKEVEEAAEVIEQEAKKAEKAVKKGARKAEKAVKAKVEKAKPRPRKKKSPG